VNGTVLPVPCPCRTERRPEPFQRANIRRLRALRCPTCGRIGFLRLPERVIEGWNEAIRQEQQQRVRERGRP